MKLSHKLLILVFVPVCFEIGFVSELANLESAAQKKAEEARNAKEIIYEVNHLLQLVYESAASIVIREGASSIPILLTPGKGEANVPKISAILDKLKVLTAGDTVAQDITDRLRILCRRMEKLFTRLEKFAPGAELSELGEFRRETVAMISSFVDVSTEMMEHEGRLKDIAVPEAEQRRATLITFMWLGVGLSVALAVALALLVQRGIVKRLNVITDNMRCFESKQPLSPVVEGSDEIASVDQFFHQMSERVLEAEAKQKELQELKNMFMSMVSHDLKAPIASMGMFLSMIADKDGYDASDVLAQRAASINLDVSRLGRMINDLMDLEKMEHSKIALELGEHSVNALIEASVLSISTLAESKQLEILLPERDFTVVADGDQLIRVLVNLLSNAVKFSHKGGKIEIQAHPTENLLRLAVMDQGRGIPEEKVRSVFERYAQVDTKDSLILGGTGLGLFVCKTIIEMHGGKIGVNSEENKGSEFWFTVPYVVDSII